MAISPTFAFNPGQEAEIAPEPAPVSAPAATVLPENTQPASRAAATPKPSVVPGTDIPNNLFSRIGFVLSSTGAGLAGQQLPSERMKARMLQKKQLDIQNTTAAFNAMAQGAKLMKALPEAERAAFAKTFGESFEKALPGFSQMFEQLATAHKGRMDAVLTTAGQFAPEIRALSGGDAAEAIRLMTDGKTIPRLEKQLDNDQKGIVGGKLNDLLTMIRQGWQHPELQRLLPMIPSDRQGNPIFTSTNLRQLYEGIPEGSPLAALKLDDSELGTFERNPEWWAEMGVRTPAMTEEALKRSVFPELKGTNVERNGRNLIVFTDEQGKKVREVDVGAAKITASDLQGAMTARWLTGEDVRDEAFGPEAATIVNAMTPEQAGAGLVKREQQLTPLDKTIQKRVADGRLKLAQARQSTVQTGQMVQQLKEVPVGAVGLRGTVASELSGWIGQVSPKTADKFVQFVTGSQMTEQQLTDLRTDMRNFIAKNISTVSGEQSGRFTEAERQITEQATRLLQAGASKDQILGAVTALYKVQLFTNYADEYYLGQTGFDMAGGTQEENIAAAQALDARLRSAGLDSAHDRKELMELLLSYQEQTTPLMR